MNNENVVTFGLSDEEIKDLESTMESIHVVCEGGAEGDAG